MNPIATPGAATASSEVEPAVDNQVSALPAAPATLLTVSLPVDARGLALGILATVAIVFALEQAKSVVISLLLGILFAYTLNPLVVWLERIKIPRVLGTSIVMMTVVCALVLGAFSLRGQMQAILEQLPEAATKLSAGIARINKGQFTSMQHVQAAASAVEKAASQAAGVAPVPRQPATHVVIDQPAFKLGNYLWAGSIGVVGFIGQAIMVIFLVFFLLLGGDLFKRKLVRMTGPSLSKKKITVHILDDINASIQRYMFMLLTINVLVALLTWIAFRWIGLENAGAWAVAAGLLHVIPYFGPLLIAGATGMAAFMQFDAFSTALLVSGTSLAIPLSSGSLSPPG